MVLRGDAEGSFVSKAQWNLPEEEGNRLIYYFISSCSICVSQALFDVLGLEEVLQLWGPYYLLAMRAYVLNRLQENRFPGLQDNKDPLLTIGVFHQHFYRAIMGGRCENMIITDRSLGFSVSDLQPPDMPSEIFETYFSSRPSLAEIIDPQYVFMSQPIDSKASKARQILIKNKDDLATTIGNEGSPKLCILPLRIDANEMDFWKRHYWGEFWRQGSSMLVEEFGEERASQIIEPYMKQIGQFYGDYFKNRFEFKNRNPQETGGVISLLNRLLKQEGRIVKNEGDAVSCEITSCPFSNSSPFICKQMAMIYNSICQAINKDIIFEYDNGLMKGEKACRWSVKNKLL
jgi:hypothetical protein